MAIFNSELLVYQSVTFQYATSKVNSDPEGLLSDERDSLDEKKSPCSFR